MTPRQGIVSQDARPASPEGQLMRDALAEVFSRVPFPDRLATLPQVCKRWRSVSQDPACWREVDMQEWFENKAEEDLSWEFECDSKMEFLIQKVVDLSGGKLTQLRTMHCSDAAVLYLARRSPLLTSLSIPDSELVTDKSIETLAACCPNLEELDVSDCEHISSASLEALGRNCKSLVSLARNMIHYNYSPTSPSGFPGGDDEAIAMSKYMVNLRHLEMKRASMSDVGARHLSRGCRQLERLNLAACKGISHDAVEDFVRHCPNLVDFVKPIIPRLHVSLKPLTNVVHSGIFKLLQVNPEDSKVCIQSS